MRVRTEKEDDAFASISRGGVCTISSDVDHKEIGGVDFDPVEVVITNIGDKGILDLGEVCARSSTTSGVGADCVDGGGSQGDSKEGSHLLFGGNFLKDFYLYKILVAASRSLVRISSRYFDQKINLKS